MGGFGTFAYGAAHIDMFSALMPICGGGSHDDGPILAKRPMRIFHGGADTTVPPERSKQMYKAIKDAGGDVQYTEYPGVGHNSWDNAYGDADAIAWLIGQRRP
jgi:predicted peptidase